VFLLDAQNDTAKTGIAPLLVRKGGKQDEGSDAFAAMLKQMGLATDEEPKLAALLLAEPARDGKPQQVRHTEKEAESATALSLREHSQSGIPELSETSGTSDAGLPEALDEGERELLMLLDPELLQGKDAKGLRSLIADAKSFLRAEIARVETPGETPKEMPKTLSGLIELARNVGVELEKITLEQLREGANAAVTAKESGTQEAAPKAPTSHTTQELVRTRQTEKQPQTAAETLTDTSSSSREPLKRLLQDGGKSSEQSSKTASNAETASLQEHRRENGADASATAKPRSTPETAAQTEQGTDSGTERNAAAPLRSQQSPQRSESQTAATGAVAKENAAVPAANPSGSDAGTRQRDAKSLFADNGTTASAGTQTEETNLFGSELNRLLRGEEGEVPETADKGTLADAKSAMAATPPPSDSLELKIGEAKEMVRHLAADLREAVQNYKPPFTRIKVQLNPGRLGEVDVTVVQRGNNVHINISGNNTAVTTLAQNATELRTQLGQHGMGNATMNFGSNTEQQQHQQRQQLAELYQNGDTAENFDLIEQLEIIVPQYV